MKTLDIQVRSKQKDLLVTYFLPAKLQAALLHLEAKPRLWKLWDYSYKIIKEKNEYIMDIHAKFTNSEHKAPTEERFLDKIFRLRRIKKYANVFDNPITFSKKIKKRVKDIARG